MGLGQLAAMCGRYVSDGSLSLLGKKEGSETHFMQLDVSAKIFISAFMIKTSSADDLSL